MNVTTWAAYILKTRQNWRDRQGGAGARLVRNPRDSWELFLFLCLVLHVSSSGSELAAHWLCD